MMCDINTIALTFNTNKKVLHIPRFFIKKTKKKCNEHKKQKKSIFRKNNNITEENRYIQTSNLLLNEAYFKININISITEYWFY
jgi:hypothetical protein